MKPRQLSLRLSTSDDPSRCASARCRIKGKRPTHTVTIGEKVFRVCKPCAIPWESVPSAKVEKIAAEAAS